MPDRRRRYSQTTAADTAETVPCERKHQTFGRTATFGRNGPSADFHIPQAGLPRAPELRFHASPHFLPPPASREGCVTNSQVIDADRTIVLEIPRASSHTLIFIHRQEMPASLVFYRLMQPVRGQLIGPDRAILEIHAAAKRLHLANELPMTARVDARIAKFLNHRRIGGEQHQAIVERVNRPFE
jgi:hypothetical protein